MKISLFTVQVLLNLSAASAQTLRGPLRLLEEVAPPPVESTIPTLPRDAANKTFNDRKQESKGETNNIGTRIVGGVEVEPPGKYPYMVYAGGCGASLVAPNVVLSAAHCAPFINFVQIGRHDLSDSNEEFETFKVVEKVRHPNYSSLTFDYDFAMFKLNGNSTYAPVTLDDGNVTLANGADLVVMGWGTTSSGGDISEQLLEVEVDYITNQVCQIKYNGGITERMLCAGSEGKDSCQGDSGGPIIDKATGTQVGVVSWGYGCADPDYPGVYARVSDQHEWIQENIDEWTTGDGNGGGGSLECKIIKKKFQCNNTTGCAWKKNNEACVQAPSTSTCQEWDGKRIKCHKEGCSWDSISGACEGKWD